MNEDVKFVMYLLKGWVTDKPASINEEDLERFEDIKKKNEVQRD